MAVDFRKEASPIVKDYLFYLETFKEKSPKTVSEYFIDLRTFFRFIKHRRGLVPSDIEFTDIKVDDVDLELIKTITISDINEFLSYTKTDRGNNSSTRLRKTSSLRGFFKYICLKKHLLEDNPLKELESPKQKRSVAKYLTLEQSIELLRAVDGKHKERDFCIITLFLNCGMRLSELVGLNVTDIRPDNTVRVLGKGNKERLLFLNEACIAAINAYLKVRPNDGLKDRNALFISNQMQRMSANTVQKLVYKYIEKIGLSSQGYSCHKLRHTAATLMYQHGNVDLLVLKEILGHENIGTTQIYTHLAIKQKEEAAKANPLSQFHN